MGLGLDPAAVLGMSWWGRSFNCFSRRGIIVGFNSQDNNNSKCASKHRGAACKGRLVANKGEYISPALGTKVRGVAEASMWSSIQNNRNKKFRRQVEQPGPPLLPDNFEQ